MSVLTVVRHGQASFFSDDYDQLSIVGEEQARLLGRYWVSQDVQFDEVLVGPRKRQQQTAELAGLEFKNAQRNWPQPKIVPHLDEYDLEGLAKNFTPLLAERDPDFAKLVRSYQQAEGEKDRLRGFQRMFEVMLAHWQATEKHEVKVESWPAFRERVRHVIRDVQSRPGKSRRVALFTSGGFIGSAVQHVLGTSNQSALELNWRIRNCSLTEFVFTEDRITLDNFNMVPHLGDSAMWTYR